MQWLPSLSTKRILLLLAVPIVAYFAFSAGGKVLQTYRLKQEENQILEEIKQLEARNLALQAYRDYVQSDEYIEKVAREELNLMKRGETAVIVLSPASSTASTEEPSSSVGKEEEPPLWKRWWDFLFN